jgi:hypothetical protein
MTANQIRLAAELGRLNGVPVGLRTARMSVGIVASAFLMRTLSRAILRRAPLLAWAFNALIAFLGTILVGNACELFYSNGADIPRTLKALIPPSFGALGEHAAIMTIEERESQENV